MKTLETTTSPSNEKFKSRLLKLLLSVNTLAVLITFVLNFLGLPILKYHYLIHISIAIVGIILFDFTQILPIILTLFFLEGQGRIVWEYASWSRIIFDALIFLSIIKIFIINKKIVSLDKIPAPLVTLMTLHFLWYVVEFSNLNSVSYFAVLAATKIYIYPLLFFLGLAQTEFNIYEKDFQKSLNFFILLLLLETILSFYQFNQKEALVLQITPYYLNSMKASGFLGTLYRPFGTSPLPGGISSYLFLTVGLLFLKTDSKIGFFVRIILISASSLVMIMCQVRSAFIKFLLIIFVVYLGELVYARFRAKGFVGLVIITSILLFGTQFIASDQETTGDASIDYVRDRFGALADVKKIKGSRLNTEQFVKIVSEKLTTNPFGLGPGLTGAAGSVSKEELVGNRFVNLAMTWTSDNLIIALIIDFGIGAIFYLLMLLYIPAYFIRFLIIYYQNKIYMPYRILLVCLSSILAILIGNWGAIGILYNPESFIFWFFTALGFSTIVKYKKIHEPNSV